MWTLAGLGTISRQMLVTRSSSKAVSLVSRERGRVGIGWVGGHIEANMNDQIILEGSVAINNILVK